MPITYAQIIKVWTPMGRKLQRFIAIARYTREAFADAKVTGTRGFDFDTLEDDLNYRISIKITKKRAFDSNVKVGQG
jgi:hypothetical protein